ncbi:MAG TPA: hypothetical protein DEB17_01510 [Chlorobaculum sp.]|jgi:hypothetical protein|uniref:Uncharacterized protein n=1 Tax=Chlorobaculum tepidum (strain ATCC 49652 / DSM 12025 / NBRC 103806 / TLS) TaxID=194439 RepID=Q8KCI6_CHLTE|nr:hypothetical protein CT1435 [Chlorobaculum tepidum TLS]HBU22675.1 hypothetical protein [Chlorobaculum sp.]
MEQLLSSLISVWSDISPMQKVIVLSAVGVMSVVWWIRHLDKEAGAD